MTGWTRELLGNLIRIKHGYAFKGEFFTDSGKYVLLTPGSVYPNGGLKLKGDREKFYSGKFPEEFLLKKGDLITVMTDLTQDASILGAAFVIDRDDIYLHNQRLGLVKIIGDLDSRFLYYYFNWQYFRDQVKSSSNGATVRHTAPERIYKCSISLPNCETQRKISAILTAYDDLIETNQRSIVHLEKMAEEIYREWFVRMRFPGHKEAIFVKGIPESWPLQRFTDVVEINPREAIHKTDLAPYVGMDKLSKSTMHFVSSESRIGAAGSRFRNRDTLLPRITPCLENGKRGFVTCLEDQQVGIGSTEFIVLREKVLPPEYIYLLSCNSSFRQHAELSMSGASGRQRVQEDCFSYFFFPTPPRTILNHFSEITRPLFESIVAYAKQNAKLGETRDLLLPRLISGKLSVADLDIQFPPSMCEGAKGQGPIS